MRSDHLNENESIQERWDGLSKAYDKGFEKFSAAVAHHVDWELLKGYLPEDREARILDAAGGTGRVALPLAKLGYSVTLCNISLGMLSVAKQKLLREGVLNKVEIFQCDAHNLHFRDESFDFSLCWFGAIDVTKELVRVTKRDGMISMLYAATGGGVFKSTDGGESWNATGTGMTTPYIHALAIDPQTPSILYAGSDGKGVFKTMDGGESWSEANHGLLDPFSNALAVDPGMPAVVYTATSNGLYKSLDRAESWSRFDHDLTTWNITVLAIDPHKPAMLYAGGHGVYKSTDGGVNWSSVSAGLPDVAVSALAIDPQQPSTLYAATARGVYKTMDGGLSWRPLGTGLAYAMLGSLAIDPVSPATLYVGTAGGDVYVIHQTK